MLFIPVNFPPDDSIGGSIGQDAAEKKINNILTKFWCSMICTGHPASLSGLFSESNAYLLFDI